MSDANNILDFSDFKEDTITQDIVEEKLGEKEIENIKDIIIPNSVIVIGKETFSECESLTSLKFPNSVEIIEIGRAHV